MFVYLFVIKHRLIKSKLHHIFCQLDDLSMSNTQLVISLAVRQNPESANLNFLVAFS